MWASGYSVSLVFGGAARATALQPHVVSCPVAPSVYKLNQSTLAFIFPFATRRHIIEDFSFRVSFFVLTAAIASNQSKKQTLQSMLRRSVQRAIASPRGMNLPATSRCRRVYYYCLNEHGHLYSLPNGADGYPVVPGALPPSGPAFLSSPTFLDFFFYNMRRMRKGELIQLYGPAAVPSDPAEAKALARLAPHLRPKGPALFPFVSLCGSEWNLVHPMAGAPVVFHSIAEREVDAQYIDVSADDLATEIATPLASGGGAEAKGVGELPRQRTKTAPCLVCAGNRVVVFNPVLLRTKQGRLYHPVGTAAPRLTSVPPSAPRGCLPEGSDFVFESSSAKGRPSRGPSDSSVAYGLIASPVAMELGFSCIEFADDDAAQAAVPENEREYEYEIDWGGCKRRIPRLGEDVAAQSSHRSPAPLARFADGVPKSAYIPPQGVPNSACIAPQS